MTDPNCCPKMVYGRNTNSPDVLIIGAGIAGMCSAIDMIKNGNGRSFVIVEKSNQVGGTWNDNTFPGCCCDVLSHLYSYSFEPKSDWSREYPGQEEIQDYLIDVAHKWGLYKHMRFNSAVEEARWDDTNNKWKTHVKRLGGRDLEPRMSYTVTSDFLVSAVGQLSTPKIPNIEGLDDFQGKTIHSSRWDWDYNIRGKRVGIIGTGATAAQIIPEIAQSCDSLVVFQRSPAWVVPRGDQPISKTRQSMFRYLPPVRKRYRASVMDGREGKFSASFNPDSNDNSHVSSLSIKHMNNLLPGEANADLRKALTPDYPFSCKRIIVSDDLYPALGSLNVHLETTTISFITKTGIAMTDGAHHTLDCLILATGFKTTQFLHPIRIYGVGGVSLSQTWSNGPIAYLGMTVPTLPNFGMLYGPNTNLAYNSLILQIEAQSLYLNTLITAVLHAKRSGKSLRLEPKQAVTDAYNDALQAKLSKSTFANPACTSWFKDERGRITNNWAGSAIEYQKRVCFVDWSDFEVLGSAAAEVLSGGVTRWKRRREETRFSDRALVMGLVSVLAGMLGAVGLWKLGALVAV